MFYSIKEAVEARHRRIIEKSKTQTFKSGDKIHFEIAPGQVLSGTILYTEQTINWGNTLSRETTTDMKLLLTNVTVSNLRDKCYDSVLGSNMEFGALDSAPAHRIGTEIYQSNMNNSLLGLDNSNLSFNIGRPVAYTRFTGFKN